MILNYHTLSLEQLVPFALQITSTLSSQPTVQFSILAVLRQVLIKKWDQVSSEFHQDLRVKLLEILSSVNLERAVQATAFQIVTIIVKRKWFSGTTEDIVKFRENIFDTFEPLLSSSASPNQQALALVFYRSLVDQFSSTKSDSIGFTWEQHHLCSITFQKEGLKPIWKQSMTLLQHLLEQKEQDASMIRSCLATLNAVLCWHFEDSNAERMISFRSQRPIDTICPGYSWYEYFISSGAIKLFFQMYSFYRNNGAIAQLLLSCITQMASLNGSIFEIPSDNNTTKIEYVKTVLSGVMEMMSGCQTNTGLTEIQGLCTLVSRVTTNFRLSTLIRISDLILPFCELLSTFTCNLLSSFATCEDLDVLPELESCFDSLLEAWVILASDSPSLPSGSRHHPSRDHSNNNNNNNNLNQNNAMQKLPLQYSSKIWMAYVEARLKVAQIQLDQEEPLFQEDDFQGYEEQLAAVSFLGRREVMSSLAVIDNLIETRKSVFSQLNSLDEETRHRWFEELHWIILIAGHLLADSGLGEAPMIPERIVQASNQFQLSNQADLTVSVVSKVFTLIQGESQALSEGKREFLSPLLSRTFVWFMDRWHRTYLFSKSEGAPQLQQNYGLSSAQGSGCMYLDFMFTKILTNFQQWSGENELLDSTAELLLALAQFLSINPSERGYTHFESLNNLFQAHVADFQPLVSLSSRAQMAFVQALTTFSGVEDEEIRRAWFQQVVSPVGKSLLAACESLEQKQLPLQLQRLRGIAQGRISEGLVFSFLQSLLSTLNTVVTRPVSLPVLYGVAQVYADIYTHQAVMLGEEELGALDSHYGQALLAFATYHTTELTSPTDPTDQALARKTIIALLRGLVEAADVFQMTENGIQLLKVGLSFVLSLVTDETFEFPKLAKYYFRLVYVACQNNPSAICQLPPPTFQRLFTCFKIGVSNVNDEIARHTLEALRFVAEYNAEQLKETGNIGLAAQEAASPGISHQILQFLLNFELTADFSPSLNEYVSAPLYFFACVQLKAFEQMVVDFVSQTSQGDRVRREFQDLVDGLTFQPDRKAMAAFKEKNTKFITNLKTFLLTK